MSKWSGIGPAVDAHLFKWSEAGKAKQLVDSVLATTGNSKQAVRNLMDTDIGSRWITFGMSYGIVDDDGKPMVSQLFMEGTTITGRERFDGDNVAIMQGAMLAAREYNMLSSATSHYISAEVVDEVNLAASMAQPEPLYEMDLFTPCGFAVLEKPLIVNDLDPDTGAPRDDVFVWVRAIGWQRHGGIASVKDGTIKEGVSLFLYTTPEDYREGYVTSMLNAGLTVKGFDEHGFEEIPWDREDRLLPLEVIPWAFGSEWAVRNEVGYRPGTVPSPVGHQRRWFYAFMRLCWQQIIVPHRSERDRAQHRRWQHMAKRKELLDYSVLRLRRHVDPNYEPSGMGLPLEHRVKVRAHWRYQYHPSLGVARLPDGTMDPESHRWIWVEAFWKGPEGAPIGAMHPATSVVR